jgi:hypothetical protein
MMGDSNDEGQKVALINFYRLSKRYSVFYLLSVHHSVQKSQSDLSELILIKFGTGELKTLNI